jgi:hypothetical protein
VLLLRYGGAILHRRGVPVFIGLIVGETAASAFWLAVPAVLVALGRDYEVVIVQP